MGGRLLQGLQQGVEGLGRKHMYLVDDVDLEARLDRGIAHALDQFADVANAGAACRIHLDDIHMAIFADRLAMPTLAAGRGRGSTLAVGTDAIEGARQDARGRGLAYPAHAGQHIALGQASAGDRVGQRAHQRVLSDHVGEGRGPVLARQDAIGRGCGRSLCHAGADGGNEWETGERPAGKLVTAASFRT